MKNKYFFTLIIGFLLAMSLTAQEESNVAETPIRTDRPSQTYSSYLVQKGVLQIESGVGYVQFNRIGSGQDFFIENFTVNTTQLRYGVSKNIELRFSQNISFDRLGPKGDKFTSDLLFAPTSIGAKIHVIEERGYVPEISFLGEIGSGIFSDLGDQNIKLFRFNFSNTISSKFSIAYSLGMNFGNNFRNSTASISLLGSYALSNKISAFAEYYTVLNPDFFNTHNYDFGVTYLVNNNLQLDMYAGSYFKENGMAPNLIFGFGFATRLFNK
jgi:hypothetical protein